MCNLSANTSSEFLTLADAFTRAGSTITVGARWKADDADTATRMEVRCRPLRQGESLGEALRQAQLGMLYDRRTADRYLWAAFTLIGGWR